MEAGDDQEDEGDEYSETFEGSGDDLSYDEGNHFENDENNENNENNWNLSVAPSAEAKHVAATKMSRITKKNSDDHYSRDMAREESGSGEAIEQVFVEYQTKKKLSKRKVARSQGKDREGRERDGGNDTEGNERERGRMDDEVSRLLGMTAPKPVRRKKVAGKKQADGSVRDARGDLVKGERGEQKVEVRVEHRGEQRGELKGEQPTVKRSQEEVDLENEAKVDALLKSYFNYSENNGADQKSERRRKEERGGGGSERRTKEDVPSKKVEKKLSRSGVQAASQAASDHRQAPGQEAAAAAAAAAALAVDDRVAVLRAREKALLEAIVDLSSQNEDLIQKLEVSMRNELELERRVMMLSTGMEEGQFPRAGGGGGGGGVAGTSVSSDESQARGRRSSVKARLGDALKGGRSGTVPTRRTHTDY